MSCKDLLPLLKTELDRMTRAVSRNNEYCVKKHFEKRNKELSYVFFFYRWFGVKPTQITMDEAKYELDTSSYKFYYVATYKFDYVATESGDFTRYGNGQEYLDKIKDLYYIAKKMVEANPNGTMLLTSASAEFLTWTKVEKSVVSLNESN